MHDASIFGLLIQERTHERSCSKHEWVVCGHNRNLQWCRLLRPLGRSPRGIDGCSRVLHNGLDCGVQATNRRSIGRHSFAFGSRSVGHDHGRFLRRPSVSR